MDISKGSVGLDSVQRSTMQMPLNDRISVRVWDGILVPIRKLLLTVDLPSYSHRRTAQIDAGDLVKTVRKCFVDSMLQSRQYLLAISNGARLRLHVIGMDTPVMDCAVALGMGSHKRLGAMSALNMLKSTHLQLIADLVWGQSAASQHFILTRDTLVECRSQPNSPVNLRQQVRTMFLQNKGVQNPAANKSGNQLNEQDDAFAVGFSSAILSTNHAGNVVVNTEAGTGDPDQRLLPGDIVESINGQSIQGVGAQEVYALSQGKHGSFVTFGVQRGASRTFITLERDQTTSTASHAAHQPVDLFSDTGAYHHSQKVPSDVHGRWDAARGTIHNANDSTASGRHATSPTLSSNTADLFLERNCRAHASRSALTHDRRARSPIMGGAIVGGAGDDDLQKSLLRASPYSPRCQVYTTDGRIDTNVGLEDLAKENTWLRVALVAQQTHSTELMREVEHKLSRAALAEQLARGLASQVQLAQHALYTLHTDLAVQLQLHDDEQQHQVVECCVSYIHLHTLL